MSMIATSGCASATRRSGGAGARRGGPREAPRRRRTDPDRRHRLLGERLNGRGEALVVEYRRKDPARELAQLGNRRAELRLRLRQLRRRLRFGELRQAQRQRETDEPLLRAVVEVALESLSLR